MIEQLLFILGGIGISVIGYFLKRTLDELEKVKLITWENKNKLLVLEVDNLNKINSLNEKFEDLKQVIRDLTIEIKELNKKMK